VFIQHILQSVNAEMLPTNPTYHLVLFVDFFQNGGDIQDGVWYKYSSNYWTFLCFLYSNELIFGPIFVADHLKNTFVIFGTP
jgi:hypothetical protein